MCPVSVLTHSKMFQTVQSQNNLILKNLNLLGRTFSVTGTPILRCNTNYNRMRLAPHRPTRPDGVNRMRANEIHFTLGSQTVESPLNL